MMLGERSHPDGSTIGASGSGRLSVRGQSCKLTGCQAADLFSPGWSLLVLLAWPAAGLAAAALLITRRDA